MVSLDAGVAVNGLADRYWEAFLELNPELARELPAWVAPAR